MPGYHCLVYENSFSFYSTFLIQCTCVFLAVYAPCTCSTCRAQERAQDPPALLEVEPGIKLVSSSRVANTLSYWGLFSPCGDLFCLGGSLIQNVQPLLGSYSISEKKRFCFVFFLFLRTDYIHKHIHSTYLYTHIYAHIYVCMCVCISTWANETF